MTGEGRTKRKNGDHQSKPVVVVWDGLPGFTNATRIIRICCSLVEEREILESSRANFHLFPVLCRRKNARRRTLSLQPEVAEDDLRRYQLEEAGPRRRV